MFLKSNIKKGRTKLYSARGATHSRYATGPSKGDGCVKIPRLSAPRGVEEGRNPLAGSLSTDALSGCPSDEFSPRNPSSTPMLSISPSHETDLIYCEDRDCLCGQDTRDSA
ncbi:hypothetical protein AVEN_8461-1 [Araneus ventricosus]|uniref:Uncharacterized protein n=1 Tax=Araneus ventricosus TaxID=182803 RepID=A0A4Y2ETP4_ARAVE|nr:hypothetical protein AVEN_8461-1 [Araneus ventricosus]